MASTETLAAQYAEQIGRAYPDLALQNVELRKGGQYNDVLVVNRELLFRFPKVPAAVAAIEREAAVLPVIGPLLPLPVPQPLYVSAPEQGVGAAFMGYALLPGKPLWGADLQTIDEEAALERIARQLAEFLLALHAVPLSRISSPTVPVKDDRASWADLYRRIRRNLFPHMRPDARRRVRETFATFLDDPLSAQFDPALRHGDFGGGNVLWEPASGVVTGVIDFSSVAVGDPATDLASVAAGFGDAFLERCSHYYPITPLMRARMTFYRSTFALQEALFGAENDDPVAFAAGMAAYT